MSDSKPLPEAFRQIALATVEHLPYLLSALVVLAGGWLVSRLLAAAAQRLAARLHFDEQMEKVGWTAAFARAEVHARPSQIIGRLVFWTLFLFFLVLSAENLGLELTAVPLRDFLGFLPHVLGAVVLLFGGIFLALVLSRGLEVSLAKIEFEHRRVLSGAVRWLVLMVTILAAVEHLGFDVTVLASTLTNLVTILAAGLVATFALGGQEAARNMLSGFYAREKFQNGDIVVLPEGRGELESIGTLSSEIRLQGEVLVIPNRRLVDEAVRRVDP